MYKHLEKIGSFLDEIKAKYPDTRLERNGDIQYANGNDGTDFDWSVNNRLCELGCGYGNGDVWAFKLMVYTSGNAECYCYPNGELQPVETIKRQLFTEDEVEELYHYMLRKFDGNFHWDCFLVDVEED